MAQRKKTPKHLVVLIQKFDEYLEYAEERMRVKLTVPVENQADHIRSCSLEEMIGQVTGAWVMLENALTAYGCYAGFMYVSPQFKNPDGSKFRQSVNPSSNEFAEWRRTYFTRA